MAKYGKATYGDAIAEVYDSLSFPSTRTTDAAVKALARLARKGPALELGVGTGRVAIPLAARGVAVHGIDGSQAMLEKLAAKRGGRRVKTFCADFAKITLPGPFRLIYAVFNTFFALQTQDAQVRCFQSVAEHLDAKGKFVIEAFVPDVTMYSRGQAVMASDLAGDAVRLDVARLDAVRQFVTAKIVLLSETGVRFYPIQLRFAYPSELDLMARLAGLRLRERWGSWEGGAFTSASGNHISVYERG